LTVKQAKELRHGDVLYHRTYRNSDGTAQRWRVSGKPHTWKRDPKRVEVPVKHGMYDNDRLDEHSVHLVSKRDPTERRGHDVIVGYDDSGHASGAKHFHSKREADHYAQRARNDGVTARVRRA